MGQRTNRNRAGAVLLAFVVVSCVTTTTPLGSGPVIATSGAHQVILNLVRTALQQEPGGTASDSLFAAGATFVANGVDRTRRQVPRYAGIGRGGVLRILGLQGEVIEPYGFAVARYRWDAPDGSASETGQATFILQLIDGRWKVRHVHSSMILPWDQRLDH